MTRREKFQCAVLGIVLLGIVFVFTALVMAEETTTIAGTVSNLHQIVGDDGKVYQIGEGIVGAELGRLVGTKVKVTGGIEEAEGEKILTVKSYEMIGQ